MVNTIIDPYSTLKKYNMHTVQYDKVLQYIFDAVIVESKYKIWI